MTSNTAFLELIAKYQDADTLDKTIGYIAFAKFELRRRAVFEQINPPLNQHQIPGAIQAIELSIPDFLDQAQSDLFAALDEYASLSIEKEKDRLYAEVFEKATNEIKSKLVTSWTNEIIKGVAVTVASIVITGALLFFLDLGRAKDANDVIDQLQQTLNTQGTNPSNSAGQKPLANP